jgi:hypothetical protein
VILAERGTPGGERAAERGFGIGKTSGVLVEVAEVVQRLLIIDLPLNAGTLGLLQQFQALVQQSLAVVEAAFQTVDIAEAIH